ncbi:MAG: hypothetical protein HQL20_02900 [Candidatus Omnitrophica bacterium]|nr:hypothetical protein [Candidatus Omnitrophota bacterium]
MDYKKILLFGSVAVAILGMAWFAWTIIYDSMTYAVYSNDKEGIAMKYPKGWKLIPNPDTGAMVAMVKPKENPLILFQANWNISSTRLSVPLTLDQYVTAANAQVQFMFKDAKATASPIKLSGHEGRQIVYINNEEGGMVLICYVFIYQGSAYNITYMDFKESYLDPKKRKAITDVIRSLKVKF